MEKVGESLLITGHGQLVPRIDPCELKNLFAMLPGNVARMTHPKSLLPKTIGRHCIDGQKSTISCDDNLVATFYTLTYLHQDIPCLKL
ncbi:MAG: hypothetical protein WAW36_13195 [Methylovulum miyakonense]